MESVGAQAVGGGRRIVEVRDQSRVDVLKELKAAFMGRVNFIHVEVFDNPVEMRDDVRNGRLTQAMVEWGLETEPFTFVMDARGNVSAKFEGFATAEELDEAIEDTLS